MPKILKLDTNQILEMYNQGMSFATIGKELNVGANTIKRRLEAIDIKTNYFKDLNITKSELYDMYITQNMTTEEIGNLYGANKITINKRLRKYNIELRPSGHRPKKDADIRSLYGVYKYGAKHRNLTFNLPLDRFKTLILTNCHYCGKPPSSHYKNKCYDLTYNGIDRIDNNVGYEEDNTVTCCWFCNKMKGTFTHEEFVRQNIEIYKHYAHKLITE
jgi:transposase